MSEEIPVRFRWTVDEVRKAHRWHFRQHIRAPFRYALWLLAIAFVLVGANETFRVGKSANGVPLFLLGIYFLTYFWILRPWILRRRFAKRPDRDVEIEWRLSGDGIRARSAHASSEFTWSALAKVVQTPAGFMFYPTEQIFHWLPRHGFGSQADFDSLAILAQKHAREFRRIG